MAKIKFNVKGVESRSGSGEPIPKGVYKCTVETCVAAKPQGKDERIEVVYVIAEGDHKGRKLFDYINLESEAAAWKLRQFLETFGLVTDKKETGSLDPESLVGEGLQVRVAHQTGQAGTQWEGQVQSRVGSTFAVDGDEDGESEDLDGDDDDDDDDDDGEGDEVDLDELDRKELKALIKSEELDIKVLKSMSDDDVRKAIAEAMEAEDDDDEDDEDDEDDDDEAKDYSELDLDDLKATCKERGLSVKGSKKILIARLEKDDEAAKGSGDPF